MSVTAPAVATADVGHAAAAAPAAADADARRGCVERTEQLPSATLFDPDDPRLRKGALVAVLKSARRLVLFEDGVATACYRVALGFAPQGHKQIQGDGRTPEGWYRTSDKPWSSFAHAIAIHYPNEDDARAAAADGRIGGSTRDRIVADTRAGKVPPQNTKLGGAVLIHGGGSSSDWTLGCVALDDADLLTLRAALPKRMRANMLILP
ncbi:MAG: L,D-transpeptidase family protein [Nannocystaceae bacterium]|nr:L,D-transpeptidase family protein [Nannocystaceae bacterium]